MLSDQDAISALQNAAQYIHSFYSKAPNPPVFHLINQAGTIEFGRSFAAGDKSLLFLHESEKRGWESYVAQMWNHIEDKKRKARSLRVRQALEEARRA